MSKTLPPIGEGVIVGLFERWSFLTPDVSTHIYFLTPDVSTHIYFRADEEMSIFVLAAKLGLEAGTIFSPDPNALYVECGEPGEVYTPAMFISDNAEGTAFAVLMGDVRMLKKALELAKPYWPLEDSMT